MNRQTGIGILRRVSGDDVADAEIAAALVRSGGNILRAAHDLVISRRHLYRLVYQASLWGLVDAVRSKARELPEEIRRARLEV